MTKKKKAASITYFNQDLDIPVISSYGEERTAEKILQCARENGIKIVENEDFFALEDLFIVGNSIPEDMYEIVASILAGLLETNKAYSIKLDNSHETK